MTDRKCDLCQAVTPAYICHECTGTLYRDLKFAVWIETQRTEGLNRGRRPGQRPEFESHILANDAGIKRARALHDSLVGWVRILCEEKAVTYPGTNGTAHLAAWLAHYVASIQFSQWAAEAAREIERKVRGVRNLIDIPIAWQPLGQCGDECKGYIYAPPGRDEAACKECGTVYNVEIRKQALVESLGAWPLTASEIECLPPLVDERKIKAVTVRTWAKRGQLIALDNVDGMPRYKLNDVIALQARMLAVMEARRAQKTRS